MRSKITFVALACVIVFLVAPINASSENIDGKWNVLVRPLWQVGDQNAIDNVEGYDYVSKGLYVSMGKKLNERHSLGITLGQIQTDIESDSGDQTEIQSTSAGGYFTSIFRPIYVVSGISYTRGDIDVSRTNASITADTESDTYSLYGNVGYPIRIKKAVMMTPYVGYSARYQETDAYQETGLLGNQVAQDEDWYINTTIGMKARLPIVPKKLDLSLNIAWFHEYTDNMQASVSSKNVLGAGYVSTNGVDADNDRGICGIGVKCNMSKNMSLSARYDYIFAEKFTAHCGIIGLKVLF